MTSGSGSPTSPRTRRTRTAAATGAAATSTGAATTAGRARAERGARRPGAASSPALPGTVSKETDRVLVGRILTPHGIRGELAVEVLTDVEGRFEPGGSLLLVAPNATEAREVRLTAVRVHTSRARRTHLLVRLAGVDDRTAADVLRGARLEVPASAVPPPPADTYYHFDLVGCRCHDRAAGELGEVVDVLEGGGGLLLRVQGGEGDLLLPFVESFLVEVDVAGRRIEWNLPEGLIEACGSA